MCDAPPAADARLRLYAAAWWLATPWVALALLAHAARGDAAGGPPAPQLAQRWGVATLARPAGAVLWVHAVSLGEGEAAAPLIDALRRRHPHLTLLLTAGSASASAARARDPRWAGVLLQLAPLDAPIAVARFLAHWRPCALLLLESELWPNTLHACARARVPVALVNARMSAASAARWGGALAAPLARRMLRSLRLVCPMNEEEAARLAALCPAARLGPCADLKAVAACARAAAPPSPAAAQLAAAVRGERRAGRFVWLAASTHAGEEAAAAAAHAALAAAAPPGGALTLVAPRHPARAAGVAAALAAAHPALRVTLHSAAGAPAAALRSSDVFVVDALGLLPALYAACGVAFVGNSLPPGGRGHNVAEAAAGGVAVLCGPHLGPFRTLAARLQTHGLQRVADARALADALAALRAAPEEARRRGAAGAAAVAAFSAGVLSALLAALESAELLPRGDGVTPL
jgi:3-deoxy-D-manno-octulosonic-acid transferase